MVRECFAGAEYRCGQIMVEKWHIKPDVAGATFMAASRREHDQNCLLDVNFPWRREGTHFRPILWEAPDQSLRMGGGDRSC